MKSKKKTDAINIIIAGTAGQGVITLKRLIEFAAQRNEPGAERIFGSEMHGLAQREGAIVSHTRYQMEIKENERENIHSPSICFGDADLMLAFEPVEVLRHGIFCSDKTKFIVNSRTIPPILISNDMDKYPEIEDIKKTILGFNKGIEGNLFMENFTELSIQHFGTNQKVNIIVLGVAIGLGFMPFIQKESFEQVIRSELHDPENNIKALNIGIEIASKWL